MKIFLYFVFVIVIYYNPVLSSSNEIVGKYGDGNLGDILLNKKFDYSLDYKQGGGIFGDSKFLFDDGNPVILQTKKDGMPGHLHVRSKNKIKVGYPTDIARFAVLIHFLDSDYEYVTSMSKKRRLKNTTVPNCTVIYNPPFLRQSDIHGRIERPCQVYDSFCIRKYFADHSHCKISGRKLPEPFFRAQGNYHYGSANISVTNLNFEYDGMNNARVIEFYINKVTDNLVIAINFDAVSIRSNNTNVKYYLRGREPVVNRDIGTLVFLQLTITAIIPGLDNLKLDRAEIYTYGDNPLIPFAAGPRLGLSSDPEVVAMFTYLVTVGLQAEHLEEISTDGVFYATNFIQYNICDFGLKNL